MVFVSGPAWRMFFADLHCLFHLPCVFRLLSLWLLAYFFSKHCASLFLDIVCFYTIYDGASSHVLLYVRNNDFCIWFTCDIWHADILYCIVVLHSLLTNCELCNISVCGPMHGQRQSGGFCLAIPVGGGISQLSFWIPTGFVPFTHRWILKKRSVPEISDVFYCVFYRLPWNSQQPLTSPLCRSCFTDGYNSLDGDFIFICRT